MKQERILGPGDFVERALNESGEPSWQDSAGSFRDSGAIGKRVKDALDRGREVIGRLHICYLQNIE
ncbi:MAG: hypothetical protein H6Q41_3350 [Deltaproteobacteria bacterium]|nr:hypothetical protein [Deltaproteobacteria bacterium]